MKTKVLTMTAVVVFLLGLCCVGCVDNQTMEQESSPILELNFDEFEQMNESNPAKAKEEYDGKTVKYTGIVSDITADCVVVCEKMILGDQPVSPICVYLPTSEIANLSKNQHVTVVGTFEYKNGSLVSEIRDAELVES